VLKATAFSVVTLLAEAGVVGLSDIGGPAWAIVPLLAWLLTLGLPTTLTTIALAGLWGRIPLLYGLPGFVMAAAVLGTAAQGAALRWLAARRRSSE
jgi:hypothetical protein